MVQDILFHNRMHRGALERTGETLRGTVKHIEAYFDKYDVDYEPFDPEATWN